jgi:hypothetical protein
MEHEARALVSVLQGRPHDDARLRRLVEFLKSVDPLKQGGWDEQRLEDSVQSAVQSLDQTIWLTQAFDALKNAQREVSRETGERLFRTTLLRSAIAFFMTGLPPDAQVEDPV